MEVTRMITISVMSLFFVFVTTLATDDIDHPTVLDYKTGNPIEITQPFVLRALWKGQHYYVGREYFPFIGLTLEVPRPSSFVRFQPTKGSTNQNVVANMPYYIKFNRLVASYWESRATYRMNEVNINGDLIQADYFEMKETEENRVYKMMATAPDVLSPPGSPLPYVGMALVKGGEEDKYYLAALRGRQDLNLNTTELHELRFTFLTSY